jgi:hypothetical protein
MRAESSRQWITTRNKSRIPCNNGRKAEGISVEEIVITTSETA